MKIFVTVKRVVDYNAKVGVNSGNTGVDIANVKMSMNPFDEIAMEEDVRVKEAGVATEVIAVSAGVAQAQETLHTALAIGADRAIERRPASARGCEAAEGAGRQGSAAFGDSRQAGDRRRFESDRPDSSAICLPSCRNSVSNFDVGDTTCLIAQ
jgi:hypothetical protein